MVVEISIGFVGVIGFLSYLGWRLKSTKSDSDIVKYAELGLYSLSGVIAVSLLFILMGANDTASYYPVLRVVFNFMMIILGLFSGIGSILSGVYLLADTWTKMFNRKRRGL